LPVHCNSSPVVQPEVNDYFSQHSEELEKLGYDKTKYVYPEINPVLEEKSVKNHLKLFGGRNRNIAEPLTFKEKKRATHLLRQMLDANVFEPNPNYKTKENLINIIDSTLVKCKKSPGHPYQADGLPTNANVLNKYTKQGVADLVLKEWEEKYQLKCFLKAEPTKHKKIDSEMPRVITGLPLHKMIKHQAIFREMLEVAVDNWRKSPIKYAFAPSLPGHIEHLVKTFSKRKVHESDKPNWDFMFFSEFFEICKEVTRLLAVQPADMSDTQFEEYMKDIDNSINEVVYDCEYRCTNGKVFKSKYPGAMKSGTLLTIFFNSMAQILVHIIIMMRLGYSDEEIMSEDNAIIAGGDDVLQAFHPSVDLQNYVTEAALLGLPLSDFIVHDSFDGCEFYSHKLYIEDGVWKFRPERFTKHIAKLCTTKIDDLPGALSSHMLNYCWDGKKFNFFERMFSHFRKQHPELFTLNYVKSAQYLRFKVKGYEAEV